MNPKVEYISAACNQVPHCISLKERKLIYGASNAVIEVKVAKETNEMVAIQSVVGHNNRVNCVRWIDDDQFVSGSTDKTICVWKDFCLLQQLKGHEGSVNVINGSSKSGIIVSGSTDSTMKIWAKSSDETWSLKQSYPCTKSGFVLDLAVLEIENGQVWIFASFDDCSVRLFAQRDERFEVCHVLKGHEDWTQALDAIVEPETGDTLLASGNQDSFIRVWRFKKVKPEKATEEQRKVSELASDEDIKVKEVIFSTQKDCFYSVAVETILAGHDDKVFGVQWKHCKTDLKLLSSSLDKTIILWEQDHEADGLWIESLRVGEVGGNTLGFLGCQMDSDVIIGQSFNGAFHFWHRSEDQQWHPSVPTGGHFGPVEDLDWDHKGRYLITTSKDQTTRIHAQWKGRCWHEVARPQVHGYDLNSLTLMPNHKLASGAEEKLVRVFEGTKNFIDNIKAITSCQDFQDGEFLAQGASVPSLGLSNKAVMDAEEEPIPEMEKHVKDQFPDFYFKPDYYDQPPPEETLVQNTLWPEIQKVYGHGYEIFSVTSNHSGTLLASACKAAQAEHANILIWDTKKWTKVASLENGHTLTVVQMAFSPDDKYLLTVSRDRTLCLWTTNDFQLYFKTDKKTSVHQRIIWSCDWSQDSKYFATVGRDKKCVLWSVENKQSICKEPLQLPNATTAVCFFPRSGFELAIGLEDGRIFTVQFSLETQEWINLHQVHQGHHKAVKRLKFRPSNDLLLASCGADHLVQLISFQ